MDSPNQWSIRDEAKWPSLGLKDRTQPMSHQRWSQVTKLGSKEENPNQWPIRDKAKWPTWVQKEDHQRCSIVGKANTLGKNGLTSSQRSPVTYQRHLSLPQNQKHWGHCQVFWRLAAWTPFLVPAVNTVLSFTTTQCQYMGFAAHKRWDPSLVQ